jgi:hypothetical protein
MTAQNYTSEHPHELRKVPYIGMDPIQNVGTEDWSMPSCARGTSNRWPGVVQIIIC